MGMWGKGNMREQSELAETAEREEVSLPGRRQLQTPDC
jgi:hypothetical protein